LRLLAVPTEARGGAKNEKTARWRRTSVADDNPVHALGLSHMIGHDAIVMTAHYCETPTEDIAATAAMAALLPGEHADMRVKR